MVGVAGVTFGAAVPLPDKLVHPFSVVVTVYAPDVVTVILGVDSPVLHNKVPGAVVDKVEDPQLSTTVTTGVAGVTFGAAVPLPDKLVHPFSVVVTVYAPDVVTVILGVDSPVLHNKVPGAVVDKVEDPQLSTTVTTGVAGVTFGAAVPLPDKLVHPFSVVVTVYAPDVVTVILGVDSPVLHNKVPGAVVDKVEDPQLSTTVTTGVAGVTFGAAVPLPDKLVHPFSVVVTVYAPDVVTVILGVDSPVLHNKVPGAVVDKVEDPQLSTTVTTGVAGVTFGAAVPLPDKLVHPFSVVVTVYAPDVVTVILGVDSPVLHNKVPGAVVDKVEDPQLSTTVTTGVAGVTFGAAVPLPDKLVHPFSVVVTVYAPDVVTVILGVDSPVLHNKVPGAVVDKVEDPQLSTTVTTGVAGVTFGAAVPLPDKLVHPFSVVVTVYAPDVVTVILGVDSPVLHNKVPGAVVDKVEDPQLSTTVTTGVAGVTFGAAVPLPDKLVHPFSVVVTVYAPDVVTVILGVDSPVLHNKVPGAVVDKVEDPQLSTTVTTGVAGVTFGAAVPLPDKLVHPFSVVVTVYAPDVVTVILGVDSPVLHNKVPGAVVDKVEDPQLSTTVTTGVAGVTFGAAVPLPDKLVHPFSVVVTVYAPDVVTVILGVDSPVLHNKVPGAVVDKVEDPQLSTTVTTGVAGVTFGAAVPLPDKLVHPFSVVVTVYAPDVVTVILGVDSPVLHNKVPGAVVDKVEDPQLSTTVTTGVAGVTFGAAVPLPDKLVHPFSVVVTVYAPDVVTVILGVDSPVLHNKVPGAVVDKVEDPQLSTTVTTGVAGVTWTITIVVALAVLLLISVIKTVKISPSTAPLATGF